MFQGVGEVYILIALQICKEYRNVYSLYRPPAADDYGNINGVNGPTACGSLGYAFPDVEYETSVLGKEIIGQLVKNACISRDEDLPICQDTGMAVIFVEFGQDVHITGGDLEQAINAGVAKGYSRKNTGNNTPAVIHVKIVPGDKCKIILAPKGFGSENMSALKMFPVFLTIGKVAGINPMALVLLLAATGSFGGAVTHYGGAPGPIIFGAGYNDVRSWWTTGAIVAAICFLFIMIAGVAWWKMMGLAIHKVDCERQKTIG